MLRNCEISPKECSKSKKFLRFPRKTAQSTRKSLFFLDFRVFSSFFLQYEERKFELRAADEETCDKWIFVLTFLREYHQEKREKRENFIQISVETDNKTAEMSNFSLILLRSY